MRRVAAPRRHDPSIGLIHRTDVILEAKLRPAMPDLGGVDQLERHIACTHAVYVIDQRDGTVRRRKIQPASLQHELFLCFLLQRRPGSIRLAS